MGDDRRPILRRVPFLNEKDVGRSCGRSGQRPCRIPGLGGGNRAAQAERASGREAKVKTDRKTKYASAHMAHSDFGRGAGAQAHATVGSARFATLVVRQGRNPEIGLRIPGRHPENQGLGRRFGTIEIRQLEGDIT